MKIQFIKPYMNIPVVRIPDPSTMKTGIPEKKTSMIGSNTIHNKCKIMSTFKPLSEDISRLYICGISYLLA